MKTVLIRAYLILLTPISEQDDFKLLWGIVEHDETGRFQAGDYVCSSLVLEAKSNNTFITKNSTYQCTACPTELTLSQSSIVKLRLGVEPLLLYAERNQSIAY